MADTKLIEVRDLHSGDIMRINDVHNELITPWRKVDYVRLDGDEAFVKFVRKSQAYRLHFSDLVEVR